MHNFKSFLYDLELLHGITMNEGDAINIGLVGYRHIGNKNLDRITKEFTIKDYMLEIPCDATIDTVYVQDTCEKLTIPYTVKDRILTFPFTDKIVQVEYRSEVTADNLPLITEKEKEAIAAYVAYIYYRKKMPKTNEILTMTDSLKYEYNLLFSHARVPETISQSDMDKLTDINSSWNRKVYGYSYK